MPSIARSKHIRQLKHRLAVLEEKIRKHPIRPGERDVRNGWDRTEAAALRWAIPLLELVVLPMFKEPSGDDKELLLSARPLKKGEIASKEAT